ncbi:hypothetical protein [Nocardioides sp. GY 10127]|uniref:hyaluronate lyase N-terminal domain-containing protein n=1 Tax=Nocardioides sp. GY 10127 TaxID=2569762 RepID=UPI0010A82C0E|nr:hypothetical protein [Nocardioides sp. GY 10127]TIC81959.1 hypothetical protein E8D37_12460 [Nocardioides sp. GY 10127]
MATIRFRRGTTRRWNRVNPVLAQGEPGLDVRTRVLKIGDGKSRWKALTGYLDADAVADLVDSAVAKAVDKAVASAVAGLDAMPCVRWSAGSGWPARPVSDETVTVLWYDPSGSAAAPAAAVDGVDLFVQPTA